MVKAAPYGVAFICKTIVVFAYNMYNYPDSKSYTFFDWIIYYTCYISPINIEGFLPDNLFIACEL
ncbi:hypothetical protein MgSA37_01954 [Mucilaginibacter gotjawali]|uniref:Uncharacterized protein n=2 Tax=Mucilaginibacter gotjawali TaxID=1550579 RepID=A0A839SPH8_9SPHI|nr:hypothetical protein [Mucilaginibacter gotjawali]BAU53783.1 hypothetical protein MgSA37_01954 [Mucilaginibacter gotjawali]